MSSPAVQVGEARAGRVYSLCWPWSHTSAALAGQVPVWRGGRWGLQEEPRVGAWFTGWGPWAATPLQPPGLWQ